MKLFITGISGLLGRTAARMTSGQFEVCGCYFNSPVSMEGIHTLKLDLTDKASVKRVLEKLKPDVILHTAAMTNVDECETNPSAAYQNNVVAAKNIASIASDLGSKLIHISTDQLFDGTGAWITEDDVPAPLNVYAKTKLLAEGVVLEECANALVIRTNFFGWGRPTRISFSDWVLRGLEQGQNLTMFSDVFFTPILIDHLLDVIVSLVEKKATGLFHVAGAERLSKYDFALRLSEVFGYPPSHISSINVDDFPLKAQRPKDMSLSTEKVAKYLQLPLPKVSEGLEALHNFRPRDWRQSLEKVALSKTENA